MPVTMGAEIKITRIPYEEPYHLNLEITASNGSMRGELEYYCNAKDLMHVGSEMRAYAGNQEAIIVYELGSEKPQDRFAFFLSIRVKAVDSRGHCQVRIRLNNNAPPPEGELTEFSIAAEVADINRLGELLVEFGQLKHRVLVWQVTAGELVE